jgi:hypothetical protein
MTKGKPHLKFVAIGLVLCAAEPAGAMACEELWVPEPNPTMWVCEGNPSQMTPCSFWKKYGMGIGYPNQNPHAPVAWVSCQYSYYPSQRRVTWQTYYSQVVNGVTVWLPYDLDQCNFFCYSQTPL